VPFRLWITTLPFYLDYLPACVTVRSPTRLSTTRILHAVTPYTLIFRSSTALKPLPPVLQFYRSERFTFTVRDAVSVLPYLPVLHLPLPVTTWLFTCSTVTCRGFFTGYRMPITVADYHAAWLPHVTRSTVVRYHGLPLRLTVRYCVSLPYRSYRAIFADLPLLPATCDYLTFCCRTATTPQLPFAFLLYLPFCRCRYRALRCRSACR